MHKLEYARPGRRGHGVLADVFAAAMGVAYLVGFPAFLIIASFVAVASIGFAALRRLSGLGIREGEAPAEPGVG